MLDYQRAGELMVGGRPAGKLLLPKERPLSYLRVGTASGGSATLPRVLLEHRASEFRLRIPFVPDSRRSCEEIGVMLERFRLSDVFPVLMGRRSEDNSAVSICWLDWIQMQAVGRWLDSGFRECPEPVAVGDLKISPTYTLASTGDAASIERDWQYWNSAWELASPTLKQADWWRVRPNETRDRPLFPRLRKSEVGFRPQARGTFAACLHPKMREKLGNPRYVVIQHPFRKGWLPILVLEDDFKRKDGDETLWGDTIFLDRTARDALGIGDGEFCLVYPWLRPRHTVWWRGMRDRAIGSRAIAAHVRAPARADLEKPVCRLEPEALEAIGGRSGEFVTIERVVPPEGHEPSSRWRRIHMTQRVLPIDPSERIERAKWEAPQLWDDGLNPRPAANLKEAPELEGYVDCAERLGVHPPYPSIYLNYYTRRRGLENAGLCHPVQVRVGVPGRLVAEASEFAWLVLIAILGAAIVFLESTAWQIIAAAVLALATVTLVIFRAIRSIR